MSEREKAIETAYMNLRFSILLRATGLDKDKDFKERIRLTIHYFGEDVVHDKERN